MQTNKLEIIEKKLRQLKIQKNKIVNAEKIKARKELVKQKIVVGGYFLNKIKSMAPEEKKKVKDEILATIKASRKSDIEAIRSFFEKEQ